MDTHTKSLEERVSEIEKRNRRVEVEKAWETSLFRVLSIVFLTYAVMVIIMWSISIARPLVDAIIPTIGFTLSTLSLAPIKRLWLSHR